MAQKRKGKRKSRKVTPVRGMPGMTGAGPRRDKKLLEAEMRALGITPKKK